MFHIFRTCWESPFDYGRPLGFEFHIITTDIVDWSELHQFEIGFWKTTIVQTGPQNMIGVFWWLEEWTIFPVHHLRFKTLHEGSWITGRDTGKLVVQLGTQYSWQCSLHATTQSNDVLDWGDNHAKDHVLLLPASLHILGLAQRDSLISGSYAHCPFQNSCLPSSKNTWAARRREESRVRLWIPKTSAWWEPVWQEQGSQCSTVVQQRRAIEWPSILTHASLLRSEIKVNGH